MPAKVGIKDLLKNVCFICSCMDVRYYTQLKLCLLEQT